MEPTLVTWVLVVFGVIVLTPLTAAYLAFLPSPHSPKSKEMMIGKGEEWRDKTHFASL